MIDQAKLDQLKGLATEMPMPEGQRYQPPEGTLIFRPHKGLDTFWPADQPWRFDDLVGQYEPTHLAPLGHRIAEIFGVPLIDDEQYSSVPEDDKASQLFCCLTRSGLRQHSPGVWGWAPIVVIVKYCLFVQVRYWLDAANQDLRVQDALLWSEREQQYIPVFDDQLGYIQNPVVLLPILTKYASMEGLAPPVPQQPTIISGEIK